VAAVICADGVCLSSLVRWAQGKSCDVYGLLHSGAIALCGKGGKAGPSEPGGPPHREVRDRRRPPGRALRPRAPGCRTRRATSADCLRTRTRARHQPAAGGWMALGEHRGILVRIAQGCANRLGGAPDVARRAGRTGSGACGGPGRRNDAAGTGDRRAGSLALHERAVGRWGLNRLAAAAVSDLEATAPPGSPRRCARDSPADHHGRSRHVRCRGRRRGLFDGDGRVLRAREAKPPAPPPSGASFQGLASCAQTRAPRSSREVG
jgi:hypothetical protein